MSSPDRRTFLALTALAGLAACGYTPAYAPEGAASALTGRVRAADPQTALDYAFVARIEERLGRPQAPAWGLSYDITTQKSSVGITQTNEVIRHDVAGTAIWTLKDLATGKKLAGGTAQTFTAYFASGTTVATQTAQEEASRRLMRALADQVVTRLVATAGTLP